MVRTFSDLRRNVEKLIKANGGKTASTMTKKVTILLCEGVYGTKYEKAIARDIPIADEVCHPLSFSPLGALFL